QFKRITEIQFAMRIWVNFRQRLDQGLDSFVRRHFATGSGCRPRALATIVRARTTARRAQANSVARIARPIGITIKAGPGRTISAMPMRRTVPPMTAMMSLRSRAATALNAAQIRKNHIIAGYVAALGEHVNSSRRDVLLHVPDFSPHQQFGTRRSTSLRKDTTPQTRRA